jgi:hypothetical protein
VRSLRLARRRSSAGGEEPAGRKSVRCRRRSRSLKAKPIPNPTRGAAASSESPRVSRCASHRISRRPGNPWAPGPDYPADVSAHLHSGRRGHAVASGLSERPGGTGWQRRGPAAVSVPRHRAGRLEEDEQSGQRELQCHDRARSSRIEGDGSGRAAPHAERSAQRPWRERGLDITFLGPVPGAGAAARRIAAGASL